MREIHHENGNVTQIWYGHEEVTPGIVVANIVVYVLLALGLVMPSTLLGGVSVALLGAVLGVCAVGIVLLVGGNTKHVSTFYANN